jgi:hypothetical protein
LDRFEIFEDGPKSQAPVQKLLDRSRNFGRRRKTSGPDLGILGLRLSFLVGSNPPGTVEIFSEPIPTTFFSGTPAAKL